MIISSAQEPAQMTQEELDLKAKKWTQFQQRKYGDKQVKTSFVDTGKQEMPPERK
jgi:pre-mRNA-processing factor 8